MSGYILCGTPRSGSTLLIGLLEQAGLGAPDSFLRHPERWTREWGLAANHNTADGARGYVDAMLRAGRGGSATFGLRLMCENLGDLIALLDRVHPGLPSDLARIRAGLGDIVFLHLTRADKPAQAVSLVKAEQTGLWHVAPDGTVVERLGAPQPATYDFDLLHAKVQAYERWDREWTDWFIAQGITPLTIRYDTLAADPAATLAAICAALGMPAPPPGAVRPDVARLSDATSAAWIDRYHHDLAARASGLACAMPGSAPSTRRQRPQGFPLDDRPHLPYRDRRYRPCAAHARDRARAEGRDL